MEPPPAADDAARSVLLERRGPIAIVTLNRPERRNGVTVEMCVALHAVLAGVAASDARVAVLRGAGQDFCVGADLRGSAEGAAPPTLEELGPVYHAATLLQEMPQVTLAAVDGGCAGAGMGWACACDFRFAADEARFSTAFMAVGVSGDMGLGWTLTRIVGAARARELLLFPEKISARQALDFGLVSRLYPRAELHDATLAAAEELCGRDPFALALMKANLVSAEKLDFQQYIELESARHLHTTNRAALRANLARARAQLGGAKTQD
jgi:2-(1,2-epoxy-1,2-dihydrophenyl)acetyl-CoA isomerase